MTLVEIYETDVGLYHHWIESKETHLLFESWLKEIGGEAQIHSFQKIIQSLWDRQDEQFLTTFQVTGEA